MKRWCQGPECDRPAHYAELCEAHYKQQYRGGVMRPLGGSGGNADLPSTPVMRVMRELARMGLDQADTRRTADRVARLVDERAVADAIAADCFQRQLERLVDALYDGNMDLAAETRNALELLGWERKEETG